MPDVVIRPYTVGDGVALSTVHYRSVREAALADYSPEQVAVWAPAPRGAEWFDERANDGRLVLVAEHPDAGPVAYTDLEADGHIDHAYCAPEFVGQGVASRLFDALEAHAVAAGMTDLHVEASEPARRMYLRKGFSVVRRHDFVRDGVAIHNFDMRKSLR